MKSKVKLGGGVGIPPKEVDNVIAKSNSTFWECPTILGFNLWKALI